MDVEKVELFILQDYKEPDVVGEASVGREIFFQGVKRSFGVAFAWGLAFVALRVANIDMSLHFLVTIAASPVPIIVIVSTIYYRRIIAKGFKSKECNKEKNQKIALAFVFPLIGIPMLITSFSRVAPGAFSEAAPTMFLVCAIAAMVLSFILMFEVWGQFFYKIFLIKKYCPYLETISDARYYEVSEAQGGDG